MKILMFGRGVIATQYAWALEQAGNDITFYVRPGRIAEYGNKIQLNILDARKNIRGKAVKETWTVRMIENLHENHDYNLIIVSVQHYHFKEVSAFLSTRTNNATVLVFNNFWSEPLAEAAALPQERLVWGFPQAGGGFDKNDVLNGAFMDKVTFGTFGTAQTERDKKVVELFQSAGFETQIVQDFRSWLLIHFVPIASIDLEVLKNSSKMSTVECLKNHPFWKNAILNFKELIPMLTARKVDLKASSELKLFALPPWLLSLILKCMMAFVPPVKVMFAGHNNPNEFKEFCREVLQSGKDLNIVLERYKADQKVFS